MKEILFLNFAIIILAACSGPGSDKPLRQNFPSHKYHYIDLNISDLNYRETDYVPVYSDIYHQDGTRRFKLTVTLSIRNKSLTDSAYVISVNYFDSYGKRLKEYTTRALILSPLESVEFVVEEDENLGGAGASFLVDWGANKYSDQVLIQSIMIGSSGQQGISFLSESKVIKRYIKN